MNKHIRKLIVLIALMIVSSSALGTTFNVVNYGAVVNGTEVNASANVAAFQDALAAAGSGDTVYFPAGLYYMNDAVSVGVEGVTVDGYGATLKRVSSAHPSGYMTLIQMSGADGVTIQGLTIDGNRTSMTSSVSFGIRDDYANNLTIKDCVIQNCESDGIYLANEVAEVSIINCQILSNHRQGIAITDAAGYCVIEGCTFSGNDGAGIDIEPNWRHTEGHVIRNCSFDGSAGGVFGVQLYGTSNKSLPWAVTIEDCDFTNGGSLRCYDTMKTKLINNTFDAASTLVVNGYHADTAARGAVSLSGNSFTGTSSSSTNLLTNPGFDQWSGVMPIGWANQGGGTIAQAGPTALSGSAVQITASNQAARLVQNISITPNAYYTLGGYISRSEASGWDYPAIIIKIYDSSQTEIKRIALKSYYDLMLYAMYEKAMAVFQAPANAATAQVIVGSESSESFDVCFDELFLFEGIGYDGGDLTADKDQVLRFDFGPADLKPHADHLYVTPEVLVDPNAPAGAFTYGVFNEHTTEAVTAGFKGSEGGWSRFSSSDLALTSLWFPDESPWLVSGFEVAVPDGFYYVTMGAGNVGWDSWLRLSIEGRTFSATVDPDNLYILDVAPDKVEGTSDGHLNWNLSSNLDLHASATSYGYIKTWGANNLHPAYADYAELLYLQDQIIEVSDGRLTVYGAQVSGQGFHLNFLEIAPVPPTTCQAVIEAGYQLVGDTNGDCVVDLKDMAVFSSNWLKCYDPAKQDCTPLWQQ